MKKVFNVLMITAAAFLLSGCPENQDKKIAELEETIAELEAKAGDQKTAKEFMAVWDSVAPPRNRPPRYHLMTAETGHEVSDAIRKVLYAASGESIARVAAGK